MCSFVPVLFFLLLPYSINKLMHDVRFWFCTLLGIILCPASGWGHYTQKINEKKEEEEEEEEEEEPPRYDGRSTVKRNLSLE